jgi:hypothetical protein
LLSKKLIFSKIVYLTLWFIRSWVVGQIAHPGDGVSWQGGETAKDWPRRGWWDLLKQRRLGNPTLDTANAIAEALAVPLSQLVSEAEKERRRAASGGQ